MTKEEAKAIIKEIEEKGIQTTEDTEKLKEAMQVLAGSFAISNS